MAKQTTMFVNDFLFRSPSTDLKCNEHIRFVYNDLDELTELLSFVVHTIADDSKDENKYYVKFFDVTDYLDDFKTVSSAELCENSNVLRRIVTKVFVNLPDDQNDLSFLELPHTEDIKDSYEKYYTKILMVSKSREDTPRIVHARKMRYMTRANYTSDTVLRNVKSIHVPIPAHETKSKSEEEEEEETEVKEKEKVKDVEKKKTEDVYNVYPSDVVNYVQQIPISEWKEDINLKHYKIHENGVIYPKETYTHNVPIQTFKEFSPIPIALQVNDVGLLHKSKNYSILYLRSVKCLIKINNDGYVFAICDLTPISMNSTFIKNLPHWYAVDNYDNVYVRVENTVFKIKSKILSEENKNQTNNLEYYDPQNDINSHEIAFSVCNQKLIVSKMNKAMYEIPLLTLSNMSRLSIT